MKDPAGAKEGGFLTSVMLTVIVASATISEAGKVIVIVDELKEQDRADDVGAEREHADVPEGTTSEGNIINTIPDA